MKTSTKLTLLFISAIVLISKGKEATPIDPNTIEKYVS
jgi:hypothetical protein